MSYFFPILLVILSNSCYHIITKSTPSRVNAFASLTITYLTGTITCVVILLCTNKGRNSIDLFENINITSVLLGISIVFLEFGYLQAYKIGWNISICSLLSNIALAIILALVGVLFYNEHLSKQQLIGMGFCLCGIFFLNKK